MDVDRCAFDVLQLNTPLVESIRETIRAQGPQSFAWFMQQALYHPEHGYYSSGRCAIGRNGDYFTNVSVGPLFGQLMVAQFAEIWEELGKINDFVIVEQGAHDGQFARDVLHLPNHAQPEFFEALDYRIIESFQFCESANRRGWNPLTSKSNGADSLQPFVGVHFSNELLDALPVRLISGGVEKSWTFNGDKFLFIERPLSSTVFNQAALDWVDSVAANFQRGYVITIDYGHSGRRISGKRSSPRATSASRFALRSIGHADITIQVDWTSITRRAEANGLRVAGFTINIIF